MDRELIGALREWAQGTRVAFEELDERLYETKSGDVAIRLSQRFSALEELLTTAERIAARRGK